MRSLLVFLGGASVGVAVLSLALRREKKRQMQALRDVCGEPCIPFRVNKESLLKELNAREWLKSDRGSRLVAAMPDERKDCSQ